MNTTEQKLREAMIIMKQAVEMYYVASGMLVIDGQDGYGPLREMRIFLEIPADSARAKQ